MSYRATIVAPLLRQRDDWLEQSVCSALAQNLFTQVIVVRSEWTGTSNLRVLDKLQRHHPNLVVMMRERDSFPNAINTGIHHAAASRVGLLLSDDWLDEGAVEACLPVSAGIVSTGHAVHFANGRVNEAACMDASMRRFEA
jgi:hypothetical protein